MLCYHRAASEVCNGIVNKCLNQRAKTRDLGMAILMMYVEIEKHEIVQVCLFNNFICKFFSRWILKF
jgi:hypothetical protein